MAGLADMLAPLAPNVAPTLPATGGGVDPQAGIAAMLATPDAQLHQYAKTHAVSAILRVLGGTLSDMGSGFGGTPTSAGNDAALADLRSRAAQPLQLAQQKAKIAGLMQAYATADPAMKTLILTDPEKAMATIAQNEQLQKLGVNDVLGNASGQAGSPVPSVLPFTGTQGGVLNQATGGFNGITTRVNGPATNRFETFTPQMESGGAGVPQPASPPAVPGFAAPQPPAPPSVAAGGPISLAPPVQGPISSGFGPRAKPIAGASSDHAGIDYAVPVGTPVTAAADGVVVSAGPRGGFGNAVTIRHPDGTMTLYGHLSKVGVLPGQQIKGGSLIGASGKSGTVTGPNLHFGTYDANGRPVDPRTRFGPPSAPLTPTAPAAPDGQGVSDVVPGKLNSDVTPQEAQAQGLAPGRWQRQPDGQLKLVSPAPTADVERVAGFSSALDTLQTMRESMEQFNQHYAHIKPGSLDTGPMYSPLEVHGVDLNPLAAFGPKMDPDLGSMEALHNKQVFLAKPANAGARILQAEIPFWTGSVQDIANTPSVNQSRYQDILKAQALMQAKQKFYQDWIYQNGTLQGADAAFAQAQKTPTHSAASAPASGHMLTYNPKTGRIE